MFQAVEQFEKVIAEFYNAPYAVAVDSCTHALELSLRLLEVKQTRCPAHTYLSVPMTLEKLNIQWQFEDVPWHDYYWLQDTPIIDAAVFWQKDGYRPDSLMCLSFQFQKQLNLIRGGAILTDNLEHAQQLKLMSYDGRIPGVPWKQQKISQLGFHYYMPPETAQLGLTKFPESVIKPVRKQSWIDYPDLRTMPVFQRHD